MWAREWFNGVREAVVRLEWERERTERMRASVEGGAVRYDGVPGGGTGDGMLSIVVADATLERETAYVDALWREAKTLLRDAERALGERPAYAAELYYLDALPYSAVAVRLECARGWAKRLSDKCLAWLDAHREPPARANRSL